MDVSLISCTPNPEKLVAVAARLCYSNIEPTQLYQDLTDEQIENLINIVTSNGHLSTLEHVSFTFAISGVSRSCTHQLIRHRMASYNQQSQRYVKFNDDKLKIVVPETIIKNEFAKYEFDSAMNACKQSYNNLLNLGIPAEDARYVLPNSSQSKIIVTMNARELRHFFSVRCCNRSQWEIREVAWKMLSIVNDICPRLFKDSGPGCITGSCPEGKMTCGKPYK